MEAYKSRICRVGQQVGDPGKSVLQFQSEGWQARDPGELMFQLKSKGSLLEIYILLRGGPVFLFSSGLQ